MIGETIVGRPRAAASAPAAFRTLAPIWLCLIVGCAILGTIFHAEVAAAVAIWASSTAFSHCFLVLPVAGFLAWERRPALRQALQRGHVAAPQAWSLLLILPLGLAWLAAQRLGIMEGRQLVALGMAEVLAFALLGPALWRAMAVPLLYLYFLVPFGDFLTPTLQAFTVRFIDIGLNVLAIPHVVDALVIEIPAGAFRVAEACAGLRFLIASIAFGVLYACTLYRSPGRRVLFILASIVVPIIANGLRALGIVVLGQILGSAQAATIDHILYGWLFFSLVTLLLVAAGLRFRQDRDAPSYIPPAPRRAAGRPIDPGRLLATTAAGIVLACAGPATAGWLDPAHSGASTPFVAPTLALPTGCTRAAADADGTIHILCDDLAVSLRVRVFPPAAAPAVLLQAERSLAGPGEVVSTPRVAGWRLVSTTEPVRLYAIGFWATADNTEAGGLAWRVRQAPLQLRGTQPNAWHPVLASASLDAAPDDQNAAAATLQKLITAQPKIAGAAQPQFLQ